MNHENEMKYPPSSSSSSSSSSYYYQSDFQNPNPQLDHHFPSNAPPDPSMYNYNHYYDHHHPTDDPNLVPSWYHNQTPVGHDYTANVRFDDYGRPIPSADNKHIGAMDNNSMIIIDQGVYASYNGGRLPVLQFDDYGRPITYAPSDNKNISEAALKFRVILLSEGAGDMVHVLCQIGLDGIQILDPATSRTLKLYSLDTVTKWEFKEMDCVTISEQQQQQQPAEKKKGFPDWINLMKPTIEEKDHWVPDEASAKCTACNTYFNAFVRRHHCRNCGDIFCDKCTQGRIALTAVENAQQVRVCDQCLAEVTQRLSHVNEVACRSSAFNRHEDLAKKLQEEMEKKRKTTSELKSNTSDRKMKEVECPTCTVHLQVDVPASGSKTIECSVCQHPFLVNAH